MTVTEMAGQFADNVTGLELTCSMISAKDKNHAYRLGRYDGFLAGYEAGRPKVHDLRKNPDDLPPAGMVVLISGYLGDMKGLQGLDTWNGLEWTNNEMPGLVRELWCELPTLEGIPDAGDSIASSS